MEHAHAGVAFGWRFIALFDDGESHGWLGVGEAVRDRGVVATGEELRAFGERKGGRDVGSCGGDAQHSNARSELGVRAARVHCGVAENGLGAIDGELKALCLRFGGGVDEAQAGWGRGRRRLGGNLRSCRFSGFGGWGGLSAAKGVKQSKQGDVPGPVGHCVLRWLESRISRSLVKSGAELCELVQVGRMDDARERAHARTVRMMARMTWPVIATAVVLVLGPAQITGVGKAVLLAAMLSAVAGLNLPSLRVIQRARVEGAAERHVSVLGFALGLRLLAALIVALLLV